MSAIFNLYLLFIHDRQTGSSSSHPEDLHQVSQERQEVINSELEKLVQFLPNSAHSHWVLRVGNMSFNNETL